MSQRRAIVTGAAGGIGAATMAALQADATRCVGVDVIGGEGLVACDLTDARSVVETVASAVQQLGGLDVVVNVAGISGRSLGDGPVHEATDEAWDRLFDVNVRSAFLMCRAALPHLGRGASIVNVSSVLGLVGDATGQFTTHAYAATKGAIVALTRSMAATYAADGIRVNAVAPGLVATPMSARAQRDPEVLAAARQPLTGPLLAAGDVAAAIAFLASDAARAITGTVLPVDGGWLST